MPTLPEVIVTMLLPFEHLFDPRTWRKAQLLVVGAILSPGKRTVSSALNILGVGQHGDFALYHQVLNRARWSPLQLSRVLLLLVAGRLGSSNEPLVFGIDETVERRWGRKIAAKGRYRDAVRSTDDQVVMTPGLQWVSLMLLTRIGWAGRHWALPFLTALATSARYDRHKGRRHKMVTDYAQQMLVCLRRWLPERDLVVVCDGGYAKREFLLHCQSMSKPIVVITKLRKDASLYQPAPPRRPGQIGRPRVVCPAAGRRRGHRRRADGAAAPGSGQHRSGRGPLPAGDGGPGALRRSHRTTHRPRRQRLLHPRHGRRLPQDGRPLLHHRPASTKACATSSRPYPRRTGQPSLTGWTALPTWPRLNTHPSSMSPTPHRRGSSYAG